MNGLADLAAWFGQGTRLLDVGPYVHYWGTHHINVQREFAFFLVFSYLKFYFFKLIALINKKYILYRKGVDRHWDLIVVVFVPGLASLPKLLNMLVILYSKM